jgi:hypothetical protein
MSTKWEDIRLYRQNIIAGEVIWMGNAGLITMCDFPVCETLPNEEYAYVLMKVKVENG